MSATKYQLLARYYNIHTNDAITNDESNQYERKVKFYTRDSSEEVTELIMEGNDPQNVKNDMLFAYAGTKKIFPTDGSVECIDMKEENIELNAIISEHNKRITELNKQLTEYKKLTSEIDETILSIHKSYYIWAYLDKAGASSISDVCQDFQLYIDTYEKLLSIGEKFSDGTQSHSGNKSEYTIPYDSFLEVVSDAINSDRNSIFNYRLEYNYGVGVNFYIEVVPPSYVNKYPNAVEPYSSDGCNFSCFIPWTELSSLNLNKELTHQDYVKIASNYRCRDIFQIILAFQYTNTNAWYRMYVRDLPKIKEGLRLAEPYEKQKAIYLLDITRLENEIAKLKAKILECESKLKLNNEHIKEWSVYFDAENKWPYMIIDTYERVWFSPWFSVHTCGSLQSAIQKAKPIVKAIGIDNVKLIKVVDLRQRTRIK